jgi:hypothetical protein
MESVDILVVELGQREERPSDHEPRMSPNPRFVVGLVHLSDDLTVVTDGGTDSNPGAVAVLPVWQKCIESRRKRVSLSLSLNPMRRPGSSDLE